MPESTATARRDTERYVPLSGLAVTALAVAVAGAVVMALLAVTSRRGGGTMLLSAWLLVPSGVALLLAWLAGRDVRHSAGAKAGGRLAAAAWWLALVTGAGYASYMVATDLAIRNLAQQHADRFFQAVRDGRSEEALRLTVKPEERATLPENDVAAIRGRYGAGSVTVFNDLKPLRPLLEWRASDRVTVTPLGVKAVDEQPDGTAVYLNYRVRTPEGEFDEIVGTLGTENPATKRRDWRVLSGRFAIKAERLTRLGRIRGELLMDNSIALNDWKLAINDRRLDDAAGMTLPLAERKNGKGDVAKFERGGWLTVDGKPPSPEDRDKYLPDALRMNGINFSPGNGPHPSQPPRGEYGASGVRFHQQVELIAFVGAASVPAVVTTELLTPEVVAEWDKLAGPGWDRQPTQSAAPGITTELQGRKTVWRVVGLDVRPTATRLVDLPNALP